MAMRNMTYRNLMAVIHKIEAKGYTFEEAELIARRIFAEYTPQGLSIEERVRRILTKAEWEAQSCQGGQDRPHFGKVDSKVRQECRGLPVRDR